MFLCMGRKTHRDGVAENGVNVIFSTIRLHMPIYHQLYLPCVCVFFTVSGLFGCLFVCLCELLMLS